MSNVFSGVATVSKDAEVRYLPSGQAVLNVNAANNVSYGDNQKTNWLRIVLWGKRSEGQLKDYLKKGQQIFVSGEMTTSEYTKNDGSKGFQIEINANVLDLVGKKQDGQQPPAPPPQQGYQTPQQQYAQVQQHAAQTPYYAPTQNNYQQPPQGNPDADTPF